MSDTTRREEDSDFVPELPCGDGTRSPSSPQAQHSGGVGGSHPRNFPQLIRYWREDAKLSLAQAGKLAGITKAHLWDLESGRARNPTIKTLAGLTRAYCASLSYLALLAAANLEDAGTTASRSEQSAGSERSEAPGGPLNAL